MKEQKEQKDKDKNNKDKNGAGKNIEKELKECQKLKEEYLNGWKRAKADFLNYKKEEAERMAKLIKQGKEEFVFELLPVLDDFYVAERELPERLKDDKWIEGVLKIRNQLFNFLKNQGVEEIQCLGKKFDPNFHEAVGEVEKKDVEPETIVEEVKKGYLFYGRVIRPAKVKVAK